MSQDRDPAPQAPAPHPRRNIRLLLEYDGTAYLGWQVQPQGPTVQAVLQDALRRITGEQTRVKGAGRTDSGVHALGQVANFLTLARHPVDVFQRALNSLLPRDIAVLAADEVSTAFDAQYAAVEKTYRYRILHDRERSPLQRDRCWHLRTRLNLESMREAASHLIGNMDFSSFRAVGCAASNPVRTVSRCEILEEGSLIGVEMAADGFLRHMVRNVVGTLVEVGRGRFSPGDFLEIVAARSRARAGVAAPPRGLFLAGVTYGPEYGALLPPP